jgi:Protein of unknown function (DUF998)
MSSMSSATERAPALVPSDASVKDTRETVRKSLLAAGPLASLLYIVAVDVVAASLWEGYSRTGEMVSKLFAIGSPVRPVLNVLIAWGYAPLMVAFGVGVWATVRSNRPLRVTGALLIGYGLSNYVAWLFPLNLHNDASVPMHIVATNGQLALMLAAMGVGAAAFHGRLRWYSIASLVTSVALGMVAFMFAAQEPHLVLGIGERISIGAFLLWVAVLAAALWRTPVSAADATPDGPRNVVVRAYDWVYERCAGRPSDQAQSTVASAAHKEVVIDVKHDRARAGTAAR